MEKRNKWNSFVAILMAFVIFVAYVPIHASAAEELVTIDTVSIQLLIDAEVGEEPSISGVSLTEGVRLEYAYLQNEIYDLDHDIQYVVFNDEELNKKATHPLKEIKEDTYYEVGVQLVVSDLSKYQVPKEVTILCGEESYQAGKFDILRESDEVVITLTLFDFKTDKLINGWVEEDGVKYYYKNGEKLTGFQEIEGEKYFFDADGVMQDGWVVYDNKKYYMKRNGGYETGLVEIDGNTYCFGIDGAMRTGWQIIDEKQYYFNQDGVMLSGWHQIDDKLYYFENGVNVTGWFEYDDKKIYLKKDGGYEIGLVEIEGKTYYFDADGVMLVGNYIIDSYLFVFDSTTGEMKSKKQIGSFEEGDNVIAINEQTFPDAVFREYVLLEIDTDGSIGLSEEEISATKEMNVSNKGITDLTGIKSFTSLDKLDCSYNPINELDVSEMQLLSELNCSYCKIEMLNVSGCTGIRGGECKPSTDNPTESYFDWSIFDYRYNPIKEINIDNSGIISLWIECLNNQYYGPSEGKPLNTFFDADYRFDTVEVIYANDCRNLEQIYYEDGSLEKLEVKGCSSLTSLHCRNNKLTSINLEGCTSLVRLECGDNLLTSIDIEGCTSLVRLECGNNRISSFGNWTSNPKLAYIDCTHNELDKLDVSELSALNSLMVSNNNLKELMVSGCASLKLVKCLNNELVDIDISGCPELVSLDCSCNKIESLKINEKLQNLICYSNALEKIDISNNEYLVAISSTPYKVVFYDGSTYYHQYSDASETISMRVDPSVSFITIPPCTTHLWDKGVVTREATCTVAGTKLFTCERCGETKAKTIEATGHTAVKDAAVSATYTKTGLTEGSHCSVCGKILKAQKVIPKKVKSGWINESGAWYYYIDGTKQTGWKQIGKKWYYFKKNGVMATNEWCLGYWLNKDGTWTYKKKATWRKDNVSWWFGCTGWYAKNQWQKIDDKWYYFDSKGYITTGTKKIGSKTYHFDKNGVCLNP